MVVETNFKIYGLSASDLHARIFRLFARVEYQLPNLIVGVITKECLHKAFQNGITADQIIQYLFQHAHARVAQRKPEVPENVTDQIKMWEADLKRVDFNPAYMYDDFPSEGLFAASCAHAEKIGAFLWKNSKRKQLVVHEEKHAEMREFMRSYGSIKK